MSPQSPGGTRTKGAAGGSLRRICPDGSAGRTTRPFAQGYPRGVLAIAALLIALVAPPVPLAADDHAVAEDEQSPAVPLGVPTVDASLVAISPLWSIDPPSPDPTGITFISDSDRLLVSDSEVDEVALFQDVNLYTMTRAGALSDTGVTEPYSSEPSGVTHDSSSGVLYVADDAAKRVHMIVPGPDGRFGTPDDTVTSFGTACFGSTDPEGIAVDPVTGDLYLVDGTHDAVFRVSPGTDAIYDGADDVVSSFDVGEVGAIGPEGIAYDGLNGNLLVVDGNLVYEFSRTGVLVRLITITAAGLKRSSGIVLAPATSGSGWNMFVTDRGVDNSADPLENDGYLAELSLDIAAPAAPPPVANPGATVPACGPGGSVLDDDGDTHEAAIEAIRLASITFGCDSQGIVYCPQRFVIRAQMASFLSRALSLPPASSDYFTDDNGNTHEDAINRVAEAGITVGCAVGQYCPADGVTRAQMASFLARALDLLLLQPKPRPTTTNGEALDAQSALDACADPLQCAANRSISADAEFHIKEGAELAGWSSASPTERNQLLDAGTRTEFRVNGGDPLASVETLIVDQSDVARKDHSFQFPSNLVGPLEVEVSWYELGVLVGRVVLTVEISP